MFNATSLQKAAETMTRNGHTLAVAESVTAGFMQAAFASSENAKEFFQGGITVYNAKQKFTHLHVDLTHAISCNCVSELIATEMTLGVNKTFSSDWAIGITGYASPIDGHDMNLLYAYYAISFRKKTLDADKLVCNIIDPIEVQLFYVDEVVKRFLAVLQSDNYVSI